jgi:hypothetical protein
LDFIIFGELFVDCLPNLVKLFLVILGDGRLLFIELPQELGQHYMTSGLPYRFFWNSPSSWHMAQSLMASVMSWLYSARLFAVEAIADESRFMRDWTSVLVTCSAMLLSTIGPNRDPAYVLSAFTYQYGCAQLR